MKNLIANRSGRIFLPVILLLITAAASRSQSTVKQLTAADYAHAEHFLAQYTHPLVFNTRITPFWVDEDHFWYRSNTPRGVQYFMVNAKKGTRKEITYDQVPKSPKKTPVPQYAVISPDGLKAAFIREYNLWVRNLKTGEETQLTTDGVKDYGYATNNAGWTKSKRPVLLWSPDSKKIVTFQHDARGVGKLYLVSTKVGHPDLKAWKCPLPGDSLIFRIRRVIIFLNGPRVVSLKMSPDPHRGTIADHITTRRGNLGDAQWSPDGSTLAFVSSSRDHKTATLRIANPET
ncbi:MAG: DPP IV N-terminal domain-containing protein, partial [Bacteroidales bacterium]|nr:DPP IV N-terminal domain-containing protein [Bacteroidales bacterium]